MKVALGSKIIKGPWGGGNLFTINLTNFLNLHNVEVKNSLEDLDINVIVLTEPRIESSTSTITLFEALLYKKLVNKNVIIIHRINECDERKGTNYVNKKMIKVSKKADYTIFVSSWIKNLYSEIGLVKKNSKVILSGSNTKVFNKLDKVKWNKKGKLKIVTHHWGNNWNKGFDIYKQLDILLDDPQLSSQFEFTYVGNIPKNLDFKNVILKKPLSDYDLSKELKSHDLYITGSLNEPSGNHHIEAALCGLPVLYLHSGGIPEYQNLYGIEFSSSNLKEKLIEIHNDYEMFYTKNLKFPFESDRMCREYYELFKLISVSKISAHKKSQYFYKIIYRKKVFEIYKKFVARLIYQIR